jgi:hypothetical protein
MAHYVIQPSLCYSHIFGGPREKNFISWNRGIFVFRLISTDILHTIVESVKWSQIRRACLRIWLNFRGKIWTYLEKPRRTPIYSPAGFPSARANSREHSGNCSAESGGARDISCRAPGRFRTSWFIHFFFQISGSNRGTGRRSFPRGPEESWGARISPPTCSPNDTKS